MKRNRQVLNVYLNDNYIQMIKKSEVNNCIKSLGLGESIKFELIEIDTVIYNAYFYIKTK